MNRIKFDEEEIINLYISGKNTVEISKKFNSYNTTIRRILLRNNIKLRSNSENCDNKINNIFSNKYNLSKEEQYWLGLLITDGCISNSYISLSLKEEDKYILEKFALFVGNKINVNKYYNKKYSIFEYQVKFKSKRVENNLNEIAEFKNKSLKLKLFIPLTYDILRGIIDGDGYVRKVKNSIVINICSASFVFINQLEDFFQKENIKCYKKIDNRITRKNILYNINIYNQKYIHQIYFNLYCSTDLFLKRKRNIYGCLLEKFKSKNPLNSGKPLYGNPEPS